MVGREREGSIRRLPRHFDPDDLGVVRVGYRDGGGGSRDEDDGDGDGDGDGDRYRVAVEIGIVNRYLHHELSRYFLADRQKVNDF